MITFYISATTNQMTTYIFSEDYRFSAAFSLALCVCLCVKKHKGVLSKTSCFCSLRSAWKISENQYGSKLNSVISSSNGDILWTECVFFEIQAVCINNRFEFLWNVTYDKWTAFSHLLRLIWGRCNVCKLGQQAKFHSA